MKHLTTKHSFARPLRLGLAATLLLLASGVLIVGCQSNDKHESLSGPPLSLDDMSAIRTEFNKKNPAGYSAGTTPGIVVTMNFTEYHIDGQPYGDWILHASWRVCRKSCPELITADVPVTIDAAGQGSAFIPSAFLNEAFQLTQQKFEEDKGELGIWWNTQALVLDLYGSGQFLDYYDVNLGQPGWTYELSAGGVAGGLQQLLEALGVVWWPGKAGDLPQNLALAVDIGRCIGITEIPPAGVAPFGAAPFLEVVAVVSSSDGTEDIWEFFVQEPGGATSVEMWYEPGNPSANANGLVISDNAPSLEADDTWASGNDPFRITSQANSPLDGIYHAVVTNEGSGGGCPQDPLPVALTVKTHTTTQNFSCNVTCGDPTDNADITITFPSGTIQAIECD